MIRTRKKTIVPRTPAQAHYMRELTTNDMIFALGPAGTGKTYIAVAQAVSQLISGSIQRLILSRPAVEAGEKLGFLPGDMKEKVDPYLRPLYDALNDCLPAEQVERRIASGEIEIAPIAFMRGRTLADAFIILDEAQNTTPAQMKMFLTRFGENSRMVICGDPNPDRFAGRRRILGRGRRDDATGGDRGHIDVPLRRRRCRAPPDRGTDRGGLRRDGGLIIGISFAICRDIPGGGNGISLRQRCECERDGKGTCSPTRPHQDRRRQASPRQ